MAIKLRDFQEDFLKRALTGLTSTQQVRVAVALDAAICFGVLESHGDNESLKDIKSVEGKYWASVERLKLL